MSSIWGIELLTILKKKCSMFFMKKIEKLTVFLLFAFILTFKLDSITKVWVDEPWYANTAYNFAKSNILENTNVGMRGGDDNFFYTFLLGLFYKVFPTTLYSGRLFSSILGLILLTIFFKYIVEKNYYISFLRILALAYIITNVNYIVIFRTIRPESLGILLTMVSVYLLSHPLNVKNTILLSIFSFLSFLTHPSYAFLSISVFIILLFNTIFNGKESKKCLIYFVLTNIFLILLFILFIILIKKQSLPLFFKDWFPRVNDTKGLKFGSTFYKIKDFVKDYSLGIKRVFILFYEILSVIIGIFYFKKNETYKNLSILAVFFLFFNFFILKQISLRFFSTISLFSFLIILETIKNYKDEKKGFRTTLFTLLTVIYILNNFAGMIFLYSKDKNNTPYSLIEKRISETVPENTVTLSLLNLWFPLKNTYNINEYTLLEKKGFKTYEEILEKNKPDYIIITEYLTRAEATTSGRYLGNSKKRFFTDYINFVFHYMKDGYMLFDTIETIGYGTIKIFKKEPATGK